MSRNLDTTGLNSLWGKFKSALGGKVDKEKGKSLSTNDYTTQEKNKLAGIAENATANKGTITGIKINGTYIATSGDADLGNFIPSVSTISNAEIDRLFT